MGLGLKTATSGDFLPRIQYDARAGRFFQVDRIQDSGGQWENDMHELPMPFRVMADLENIEIGWIRLDSGVDFQMAKVGQDIGPQPSDKHRQGFRVLIHSKALGLRYWNHSAKSVIGVMDELYDAWEGQKGGHANQVPVVEFNGTDTVTTGNGAQKSTNYRPRAAIVDWQPRDKMPAAGDESTAEAPQATAANSAVPPPQNGVSSAAQATAGEEF